MSRNGNFNGYHDVLVRLIGGEQMREVFEPIWLKSGKYPSRAILERFPQLTRTEEARALADHWGLPKPSELDPLPHESRGRRRRVTVEQIWLELTPLVVELVHEEYTKLYNQELTGFRRRYARELEQRRDAHEHGEEPPPRGRLY